MQRLDLGHPGKGQLVIGPLALGDDGHLVCAGAFERPVIIGGDVLDDRKRIVQGIDDAFEEGHFRLDLTVFREKIQIRWLIRPQQADTSWLDASLRLQSPDRAGGLPGSSDVICGIGATAGGVRPQPKRRSSTADRAPKLLILRTNRSRIRAGRVRRAEFAPSEPDWPALIVNFAEANRLRFATEHLRRFAS